MYCIMYNILQVWDLDSLKNTMTLTGHTGSVLCMQYDENIIITGSSDASIRSVGNSVLLCTVLIVQRSTSTDTVYSTYQINLPLS